MRGPMCSTRCGPGWIDDGTLCLNKTYEWGPKGVRQKKKPNKCKTSVAPLEELLQMGAEKLQAVKWGNPTIYGKFDRRYWNGPYTCRRAIEEKLIAAAVEDNKNLKNVKQILSVTWIAEYDLN